MSGLLLGIYNTLRARERDRVKLTVAARWEKGSARTRDATGDGTHWLTIEIVNRSVFPVIVKAGGFETVGKQGMDEPYSADRRFPFELQPRAYRELRWRLKSIPVEYIRAVRDFAVTTATGETVRLGKTRWRQLAPQLSDTTPMVEV